MQPSKVLTLLYRGDLASCNYDCAYCPFAKRRDTRATLAQDAAQLQRFVAWIAQQPQRINLLFTPWGEALPRRAYQQALVDLSHLPQIVRVSIQTNLSQVPSLLSQANPAKVGLWCTFHPSETSLDTFVSRVWRLQQLGVYYSVGLVAKREHFSFIEPLRAKLPPNCYLWFNAYWDEGHDYYSEAESAWLSAIDPWFSYNVAPKPSLDAPCYAGETAFSVDGQGNVKRCHFVTACLGNLYQGWSSITQSCPNQQCDCYIGYIHRKDLPLQQDFGEGVLTRVPGHMAATKLHDG